MVNKTAILLRDYTNPPYHPLDAIEQNLCKKINLFSNTKS
ncbi:MAG: hypothetical protein JWM44_779 [Bacilli bacterium]|jgi:hypothetical protein|nr:hypothetical protein [Bacilli bacterium]